MPVRRDLVVTAADGARLLIDLHLPASGTDTKQPGDGVLVWIRTPYGRKGIASIAKWFARSGAHVLVEAMRGTDGSGGRYEPFSVTPEDAAEVLSWVRGQPWFAGVIVTWGVSAIGYASWALTELDVPEWQLAILQDAPSELHDGLVYPGGIFAGKVMLGFLGGVVWQAKHSKASLPRTMLASVRTARRARKVLADLPLGTADQRLVGQRVDYFQDWLAHAGDEDYWKPFDRRRGASGMPPLVHLATGWYDIALGSTLADYRALQESGKTVRLLIGPWYHGRGVVDRAYRADAAIWLAAASLGNTPDAGPPVRVYVGGVNTWRDLPDWPPAGYQPSVWHLHPGGGLAADPAPPSPPDGYRYDPARPTPAVGGAVENYDGSAGAKDNRKLERRPDVLTYTSETLTEDLEVIGPVTASISFRSSLPSTDLVARLCDVHPNGKSINLCDGARRLHAGQPSIAADGTGTVNLDLSAVAHVFRRGHRIRLQISSAAHPRLVRNAGTDEPLATGTTLRPADQEILHDPEHLSTLTLPCASRL